MAAGRLPAARRGPSDQQRDDPDRDIEIEDPAPGRGERVGERRVGGDPEPEQAALDVQPAEDRRAEERPRRHPQERQRADDAKRSRPVIALEQVRRGRRPDRDKHPAADPLDHPTEDQLVHRLGPARHQRPGDEHDQRRQEELPGAPDVGDPPRERHRDDVGEQVAVDDPAGVAELREGGLAELIRGGEVAQDRRQGRRGDHQLEPREEDPDAEDGEEAPGAEPAHRASVHGGSSVALTPSAGRA